jgi:predicted dehydrogenase
MGRHHAAAIAHAGGTLVAVVDPEIGRARSLAGRGKAARSLDELAAERGTVDVVHVCAPLTEHAELAERAIALGAHLLIEKPLAPDAATTTALVSAADRQQLMVVPVHQFLFQHGVQRLLATKHRFGTLIRCVFEAATAGTELTNLSPDDLVADILPHPLSLFARFAPATCTELDWLVISPAAGELRAIAVGGGTTFEIVISTHARPTRATFGLVGSGASAYADLYHGFAVVERGTATRTRKITRPFTVAGGTLGRAGWNLASRAVAREAAYPGLRELVRRTYDAIDSGSAPPIEARETLAVALARDAIIKAAAEPAQARTPP